MLPEGSLQTQQVIKGDKWEGIELWYIMGMDGRKKSPKKGIGIDRTVKWILLHWNICYMKAMKAMKANLNSVNDWWIDGRELEEEID